MTLGILARLRVTVMFAVFAALPSAPAMAQPQPAVSPAPSPSPTPAAGPADPCTNLLAVVTRPTVTTAVCALKPGHWLVETGYTNTVTTGAGSGVTAAYPQALIRVGIPVHNLELEVIPPSYQRSSVGGSLASGTTDTSYGVKWEIGYTSKAAYGVNVFASEPSGARAFTAGSSTYTENLNGSYTLSPEFSLASTIGFLTNGTLAPNGTSLRSGSFVPTLTLSAALPANSQLFAEAVYYSHAGVGLPATTLYDGGYQKDVSAEVQLDVEAGFAPTPVDGRRQRYVGLGLSVGRL